VRTDNLGERERLSPRITEFRRKRTMSTPFIIKCSKVTRGTEPTRERTSLGRQSASCEVMPYPDSSDEFDICWMRNTSAFSKFRTSSLMSLACIDKAMRSATAGE